MSEKRLDDKNRWRNVVVAFRMSQEEAQELNVKVALSGLSKQDYMDSWLTMMHHILSKQSYQRKGSALKKAQ